MVLSPITEPDRESQVFGEHRFRTSPPGNLVWAMTLCRQGAGHLSDAITHHHPVAGASNQALSQSPHHRFSWSGNTYPGVHGVPPKDVGLDCLELVYQHT